MIKTVAKFEIKRLEVLSPSGKVDKKLMPKLSSSQVKELYRWMVLTRAFDTKALKLQRTGRLGTYASMLGQEATIVGSGYALRKQDFLFPSFRMNGAMFIKGVKMHQIYQYFGGDERGMKFDKGVNVFPICITVGEQQLHGTGYAMGLKLQKKKAVVLSDFGDGATSEGDFHEAMNFAGVFKAPMVFLCQNNKWAISVPTAKQTAAKTIAQKAIAYGVKGIQVDGNDIFAMYRATKEAIADAQRGKPTLIEADTFRMQSHTTSDESTKYRPIKMVKEWEIRDPILRLRKYMVAQRMWDKTKEEKLVKDVQREVDAAAKKYLAIKKAPTKDMYNYLFARGGKS
jgi:pyruvate dehydrogenase E1 component alpha subunit